jgi:hypothetical protein
MPLQHGRLKVRPFSNSRLMKKSPPSPVPNLQFQTSVAVFPGEEDHFAAPHSASRGECTRTTRLRGLLLIQKPFELGRADDCARADLHGLDTATADQLIQKCS